MSLASCLAKHFSAAVKKKGQSYYNSGKVSLDDSTGVDVEATVRGSGRLRYEVDIDWSNPRDNVFARCSCPHYEGGNFCKHIWATLLETDDQGIADPSPAAGQLVLLHEYDDENEYDQEDSWLEYEEDVPLLISQMADGKVSKNSRTPSNNATWHQQLAALGSGSSTVGINPSRPQSSRQRQVLYVLDIAASFIARAPCVLLYQQEKKKNGEWGKSKQFKLNRTQIKSMEAADQEVLSLALGTYTGNSWHTDYRAPLSERYHEEVVKFELTPEHHELLLPKLCATGRFGWFLGEQQEAEDAQPLTWDEGPAWQMRVRVNDVKQRKRWQLVGELFRTASDNAQKRGKGKQSKEVTTPLSQPVLLLTSGVAIFEDHVARFDGEFDARWLQLLRANSSVDIPHKDRQTLLAELWATRNPPEVVWPKGLQPQQKQVLPRGYLKINAADERGYSKQRFLQGMLGFAYEETQFPKGDTRHVVASEESEVVLRDYKAETALLKEAADLGLEDYQDRYYAGQRKYGHEENIRLPRNRFTEIVRELTERGWQVEAEGAKVRTAGAFNINVVSGVDWFDLESDLDFGEVSASLPALLAAAKSNDGYVELSDGSRGLLPEEWLEKFAPLADLAEVHEEKLRFRPSQALLLDALLSDRQDELNVQLDRQFRDFRKKLASFAGVEPRDAPRGFQGELRDYQCDGLGWLKFLQDFNLGGCLADDMGLGKTIQVLALLQSRRTRRLKKGEKRLPSLVVAPKSVAGNWVAEAKKFAPRLVVLEYVGTDRSSLVDQFDEADMIITTYGTLRRDIEDLSQRELDYAILDESQAIKNDKSQAAKACRLLKASHRLALTGTPIENHLGELWSQFEFLNPGMLGRSSAFRNFARSGKQDDEQAQQESLAMLRRAISPFLLRRTKEEVLKDLPAKQEQSLPCKLLPADRKRYNELRKHYRDSLLKRVDNDGMNKSKMHVLEALLRLRQAACHPGLIDKKLTGKSSAKLDLLSEQLEDVIAGGHKALVFSQFTSMLAIVRDRLDKQGIVYEYLDGKTSKRQEKVDHFQNDPDCPVFLISLKAGGTGLNLTAADYVFVLDPWWNPAVEAQAIDRAHRIGQTRNVFAYRLIAKDTVEEKILELQKQKRELADALIAGNESLLQEMSAEDLQLLLS
ncbi:DEAD/DEAH box helicase [Adhaeretor mobilis]|uniref:ATP-dependent helicase HepA n=1 Tax=Adhaeretor mobilis TaxID=1930276 RepID=A0A517N3A7_9BACT|nr:DEAD/DEAH box helicase [Adhaeretor mobilis]QDT01613.1 ATP-dependent helicase HepA [Adhaeretor mobilis]